MFNTRKLAMADIGALRAERDNIESKFRSHSFKPVDSMVAMRRWFDIVHELDPKLRVQEARAAAAQAMGLKEQTVNQYLQLAGVLLDCADDIRGTFLERTKKLLALKDMPKDERDDLIRRAKAGERISLATIIENEDEDDDEDDVEHMTFPQHELEPHDYAKLLPAMAADQYVRLFDDPKQEGMRHPIKVAKALKEGKLALNVAKPIDKKPEERQQPALTAAIEKKAASKTKNSETSPKTTSAPAIDWGARLLKKIADINDIMESIESVLENHGDKVNRRTRDAALKNADDFVRRWPKIARKLQQA